MKRVGRILRMVLVLFLVLIAITVAYSIVRHQQAGIQVEREWQATQVMPIADLGTTRSLEILPLVDELASGAEFQAEHGVSYLIKTDETTILFDVGQNANASDPSPLQANMARLGVSPSDVQIVVISHNHPDHTGGVQWWRAGTFSLGNQQIDLAGKSIYVPTDLTYPAQSPMIVEPPQKIAEGVATLGTIPFAEVWQLALFQPRNIEQALAVNVADRGVVVITGCGHQTLPKLIARTHALFDEPIVAIVGGLHYEHAEAQALQPDIQRLQALPLQLIALSPHDSEAAARQALRDAFPDRYQDVMVGQPIQFGAPVTHQATVQ